MKNKNAKFLITIIFLAIIFLPSELHAQKWKNSIKDVGKELTKKTVKEIKPLTVDFKVSDVHYNPLKSLNKLTLTIDFNCENPNPIGITFNRTEFDLLVDDQLVSKFYNEKKISIPKNDKFTFQEKAEISLLDAGKTVFKSITKQNAVYTIIGKYFVDTPLGTLSFTVKLIEKQLNENTE